MEYQHLEPHECDDLKTLFRKAWEVMHLLIPAAVTPVAEPSSEFVLPEALSEQYLRLRMAFGILAKVADDLGAVQASANGTIWDIFARLLKEIYRRMLLQIAAMLLLYEFMALRYEGKDPALEQVVRQELEECAPDFGAAVAYAISTMELPPPEQLFSDGGRRLVHRFIRKVKQARQEDIPIVTPETHRPKVLNSRRRLRIQSATDYEIETGCNPFAQTAPPAVDPLQHVLNREVVTLIKAFVTPREWDVIHLHAIYGYSFREIAELLSVDTSTASTLWYRGLKKLQQILRDIG